MKLIYRSLLCIFVLGGCLYAHIDQHNEVTKLRLEIPLLVKQNKDIFEENTRLQYEIDLFESPQHLMELARHSEYSHLKYPLLKEVVQLQEAVALNVVQEIENEKGSHSLNRALALGAISK